jgi:ArsR family transcriptional regulator
LEHLPLADGEADSAVLSMVLHHLADPARALHEAARVVRPGGLLVVAELAPHQDERLRQWHHDRHLGLDPQAVTRWLSACGLQAGRLQRTTLSEGLSAYILPARKLASPTTQSLTSRRNK